MMTLSFGRATMATAAVALLAGQALLSTTHDLCKGFLPPHSVKIPVGAKHPWAFSESSSGGLNEQQYNAIIDRFENFYRDEFAKAGGTLVIRRLWTNEEVNAHALQKSGNWYIDMDGGLARHPAITPDGFSLVLCHEAGHHLGGAPKISVGWSATNEGGADYFATLKCLRRFFAEDDNAAIVAGAQIDPLVKQQCEREHVNRADQLLCQRLSLASNSVALLFMDIFNEPRPPAFGTPDPSLVTEMFNGHPHSQCRLDTYFSGSVCHVDASVSMSDQDYREGSCVQPQDAVGFRPRCWFKP